MLVLNLILISYLWFNLLYIFSKNSTKLILVIFNIWYIVLDVE